MEMLKETILYFLADPEMKNFMEEKRRGSTKNTTSSRYQHLFEEKKMLLELMDLKKKIDRNFETHKNLKEYAVKDLQHLGECAEEDHECFMKKMAAEVKVVQEERDWPPSYRRDDFKRIEKEGAKLLRRLDKTCAETDTECAKMRSSLEQIITETREIKKKPL